MDVAEALLHVRNGAWFLCLLVANVPDSFNEGKYYFKRDLLGQIQDLLFEARRNIYVLSFEILSLENLLVSIHCRNIEKISKFVSRLQI